ncbi:MAG TPA: YfiR family protein [Bryobacteraceae bacterium]|nr:YfiR family protein [Bryobacteraceae bacterium]
MSAAISMRRWWVHLVLILVSTATLTAEPPEQIDEYQVKAAFIYNFAKFVVWPARVFTGPADPVSICILGADPFRGALEQVIRGKSVDGRGFFVRQLDEAESACNCRILFVTASGHKRFHSLPENLKSIGVLTIGEAPGFAVEGGIINFKLEGGRIHFEINREAAEQQQIRISSKLLNLAEIVKE